MRWLFVLLLALAACKPSPETRVTAIIGAVMIADTGAAPVSDSVVVLVGSRIRAAGPRAMVPVPAGSEKIDGRGKFLVPAPPERIAPGYRANLLLLTANPLEDPANLKKIAAVIEDGELKRP